MRIRTIPAFLLGRRQAILEIAAEPRWLWVGLLFVLSAGFAREYDGTDLREHVGVLFVPLAASTAAALFLYAALRSVGVFPGRATFGSPIGDRVAPAAPPDPPPRLWWREFGLPSFLALFWMTAPLAWLYAVPVERFLDPLQAAAANLWFLASVAAWRVWLMIRVAAVIGGCGNLAAACLVILIVDLPVLAAVQVHMMFDPVLGSMAGISTWYSPADELVHDVVRLIGGTLCWTVPVLAAVTCRVVSVAGPWTPATLPAPQPRRPWPVFAVAWGSVLLGLALLPFFQPEQQRRTEIERLYRQGKYPEMVTELSAHQPADYPPHWQPPPARIDAMGVNRLCACVEAAADPGAAEWVRSAYLARFRGLLRFAAESPYLFDFNKNAQDIARVLRRLPDRAELLAELVTNLTATFKDPYMMSHATLLQRLVEAGLLDAADADRIAPGRWQSR